MRTFRGSFVVAVGLAAIVGATAGRIWAHGGDPTRVHACVTIPGGLVRIVAPSATCLLPTESPLDWAIQGPAGPAGPAGPSDIFVNRNFEDVSAPPLPGVTVATLSLPVGNYLVYAKFRYQNIGTFVAYAGCVYQGVGTGGLDGSENGAIAVGATVDGSMMDIVRKSTGDDPAVRLQCFGPTGGSVHIINPQFAAVLTGNLHIS